MKTFKELRESFLTEGYSKKLSDKEIDAQFKFFGSEKKAQQFFGDLDQARSELKQDYSPKNSARPQAWTSLRYPVKDKEYYFAFISDNEKKNVKFNDELNKVLVDALREINRSGKAIRAVEARDVLWGKASEWVKSSPRDLGAGDTMTRDEIWVSIGHMLGMNEEIKERRDARKTKAGIMVGGRAKSPRYEAKDIKEGKLADEMIRRHFPNVWALSAKEPKILDMFHKAVDTSNFRKKVQAYRKMTIGVFVRDELNGGYLDPRIIKKLKLTGQQSSTYKDLYYEKSIQALRGKLNNITEASFNFVDMSTDTADIVKKLAKKYGLKVKEKKSRTGINIDLDGPNAKMGNFMQNLPADALESVNEDRELMMITRKHKRELQKAQRTGNLELSDKAEEDLANWAASNGDIRGDDPDEFIEWLDDNLDQLVKGTGRL